MKKQTNPPGIPLALCCISMAGSKSSRLEAAFMFRLTNAVNRVVAVQFKQAADERASMLSHDWQILATLKDQPPQAFMWKLFASKSNAAVST